MEPITVTEQASGSNRWVFRVTVGSGSTTEHDVSVEHSFYQKLTDGKMEPDELVKRSFEFLLEREPKESILRSFSLDVIQRYFPEYEKKAQQWAK